MDLSVFAGMLAVALFAGIAGACFGYAFGAVSGENRAADAWRSMQAHRDPSDEAGA